MSDTISNQNITGDFDEKDPSFVSASYTYKYIPEEETVVITATEYDQLKKDQLKYEVLIQAGVESWEGYDRFLALMGE
jgi:hypothetical protein